MARARRIKVRPIRRRRVVRFTGNRRVVLDSGFAVEEVLTEDGDYLVTEDGKRIELEED
jgi:hypothetical protein